MPCRVNGVIRLKCGIIHNTYHLPISHPAITHSTSSHSLIRVQAHVRLLEVTFDGVPTAHFYPWRQIYSKIMSSRDNSSKYPTQRNWTAVWPYRQELLGVGLHLVSNGGELEVIVRRCKISIFGYLLPITAN